MSVQEDIEGGIKEVSGAGEKYNCEPAHSFFEKPIKKALSAI
jgi:hypothetical protein